MRVIQTNEPIVLKGRYLVTDPCYVYGNDDWSNFCDLLFNNEELVVGVSRRDIPKIDYNAIEKIADPVERAQAMSDACKAYDALRSDVDAKYGDRRRHVITLFEIDGKQLPVMSTAYGDGSYPVFDPKTGIYAGSFGVDAGLFAFIPWTEDSHNTRSDLGTVIEVDGILTCDNGNAYIDGKIVVDTRGETDQDDEEGND